ncbi:lanthionine synthetase LanC family protein [Pyxidicoccus caerfyrddinensis]|uniref:lanthionine synthetase LanC family protein n=1 Tax=Pyxidicoccus caerfyrddinensis TaxID=2709663 RepID=UPI0013D9FD41
MLHLVGVCPKEAALEGAISALAYERTLLSTEHHNWLDMRGHRPEQRQEQAPPANSPAAWCNGAPGIGMPRFRIPSDFRR